MWKFRSKIVWFWFGFFLTKYSLFLLGLFSLQGLLDDSSAEPHGREWLQISHRFNVLQLSLEHLEGQDTELKSSPCFSAAQLHFCWCCSISAVLRSCPCSCASNNQTSQGRGLIEKGGVKWQKEIYNSIMVQYRSPLRRQTRTTGFAQFCSVSDSQKKKPQILSHVTAD